VLEDKLTPGAIDEVKKKPAALEPPAPEPYRETPKVVTEPEPAPTEKPVSEEIPIEEPETEEVLSTESPEPAPPPKLPEIPKRVPVSAQFKAAPEKVSPKPAEIPAFTPAEDDQWGKLKKRILENWTGILGAVILVIGVGFFGLYVSLKMPPVVRFAGMLALAAAFSGANLWLKRYDRWREYGAWLQAVAGAITLFACFGASRIDALRFISDPATGLAVLSLGIGLNIFFAYIVRAQSIASLHVLLSLLTLMFAQPFTTEVLLLGTVVTIIGIGLSYRARWDVHLLFCLIAYFIFHTIWIRSYHVLELSIFLTGIACIMAVLITAGMVHYRKEYESTEFELLPFSVHLFNWGAFGANLLWYDQRSKWIDAILASDLIVAILAVAAIATTILARYARNRGNRWLYVTDTLVSQTLAITAICCLGRFGLENLHMAVLVNLELLIFNVIMNLEREHAPLRFGYFAQWLAIGAVLFIGVKGNALLNLVVQAAPYRGDTLISTIGMEQLPVVLWFCLVAAVTFIYTHFAQIKNFVADDMRFVAYDWKIEHKESVSLLSWGVLLLLFVSYLLLCNLPYATAVFALVLFAFFLYRRAYGTVAWTVGLWSVWALFHALVWYKMITLPNTEMKWLAAYGVPVFVLDMIFSVLMNLKKERTFLRLVYPAQWVTIGVVLFWGIEFNTLYKMVIGVPPYDAGKLITTMGMEQLPVVLWFCMVALAVFIYTHFAQIKNFAADDVRFVLDDSELEHKESVSILSWGVLLLLFVSYLLLCNLPYATALFAIVLFGFFLYRRAYETVAWTTGLWSVWLLFHALVWYKMYALPSNEVIRIAVYAIPPFIFNIALFGRRHLYSDLLQESFHRLVIYVLAAHLAYSTYLFTARISDFVPGLLYLLYSVGALELSRLIKGRKTEAVVIKDQNIFLHDYTLHCGYFFLVLFLSRHLTVHLQSELALAMLPWLSIRALIEIFALGVFGYWLVYAPHVVTPGVSKVNSFITPLLLEAILIFGAFSVVVELETIWHPVIWSVLSVLLISLTTRFRWPGRLLHYTWLFNLASVIQLAFVTSTYATPATTWYMQGKIIGPVTIAIQLIYVALAYRNKYFETEIQFPRGLGIFRGLHKSLVCRRINLAIFYPVILGIAVFLYWRFDRSLLTLLWVIEIFVVFSLGAYVKEKHFVNLALCALVFCLGRLFIYDLAGTSFGIQALVFMAVGALMLGINAIYRKYKDRIGY